MKRKLIATALIVSIICCGCGKKNAESMQEDFDKVTEGEVVLNVDSGSSGQPVNAEIPAHVNLEIRDDASNKKIVVDADVISEGFKNACVYEAFMVPIDASYVEELAKRLFDNGEYKVLLPYKLMTDGELEGIIDANKQNMYTDEGAELESIVKNLAENAMQTKDGSQERTLVEETIMYPYTETVSLLDDFGVIADQAKSDDYEMARIRGMIDGKEYELCITCSSTDQRAHVDLHTVDVSTRETYELEFDSSLDSVYGENECDYEEARKVADQIVENMVGSDYRIAAEYNRMIGYQGTTDNGVYSQQNGYRFIYTPEMMELKVAYSPCSLIIDKRNDSMYSYLPYVAVEVDSLGLISVKYMNHMEYGKCMSDRPSMISFDQMLEIAEAEMEEEIKELDATSLEVSRVTFASLPVVSEDGLAMVPAWIAYMSPYMETMPQSYALLAINALDGNVLYMLMDGNTFMED
ncbi:MAG: DUF6034 family protein [Eubacteriales bacterium]|nr:DUF6034 family protein [Eubacteriales bacterium]